MVMACSAKLTYKKANVANISRRRYSYFMVNFAIFSYFYVLFSVVMRTRYFSQIPH